MTEADERFIRGDMLSRAGAFGDAEEELSKALAVDPGHVQARLALAGVRLGQDRAAETLDTLHRIVQAAPASFLAAYRFATALAASDRHVEALEMYSRATTLLDASPYAWYGASLSALALGRVAQANATMAQVQQRSKDSGWYRRRAYDALRLGLDAAAAADARTFLAQSGWDADSVYAAFVAALAHQRLGQPHEAAAILEAARSTANIPAWTLAVADYLDDRLTADALLGRAASTGEKTEAHAYIGFRSAIAGRVDEALAHFRWVHEQGARNYPEFAMAKAELRRLEESVLKPF